MSEVGLRLGRYEEKVSDRATELLGWFEKIGKRILTSEEKAERLAARLRELGEDPALLR